MNPLGLSGRYGELSQLGSGGMGSVYKTRDTVLDIDVVIKVIKSDALEQSPDLVVRFQREAKATGRLAHDNLARVLDFGVTTSGIPLNQYYNKRITDNGIKVLDNPSLLRVDLRNTRVTVNGIRALLKHNKSIQILNLSSSISMKNSEN